VNPLHGQKWKNHLKSFLEYSQIGGSVNEMRQKSKKAEEIPKPLTSAKISNFEFQKKKYHDNGFFGVENRIINHSSVIEKSDSIVC
jgi:hypothetical protein